MMPLWAMNLLAGAGGAVVRSLLGWAKGKDRFSVKRLIESLLEGAVFQVGTGVLFTQDPVTAAALGYAGSSILGKVVRIPQSKKLPDNK
jgi:hypothetical protein